MEKFLENTLHKELCLCNNPFQELALPYACAGICRRDCLAALAPHEFVVFGGKKPLICWAYAQKGVSGMENFNDVSLSRRNFVKGMLAAGGAVALAAAAPAVKPFEAFAATGDSVALDAMVIGTEYTVTANAYVPYSVHRQFVGKDAYLTDYRNPMKFQGFPTHPQTDNATIVKTATDTYQVTIPIKLAVYN